MDSILIKDTTREERERITALLHRLIIDSSERKSECR
jgi:hypothetical protein